MVGAQVGNFAGTCGVATNDAIEGEYAAIADVEYHVDAVEFVDTAEDEHGIYDEENSSQEAFDVEPDAAKYAVV